MNSISESVSAAKDKIMGSVAQTTQSKEEPASGMQGAGTTDEPYDQGNKSETPGSEGTEPPSGQTGAGTLDKPYDQGNQPEQTSENAAQQVAETTQKPDSTAPAKKKGQGIPITLTKASEPEEERGRDTAQQSTTATSDSSAPTEKWPISDAGKRLERSVSPGTMPDGSHAQTSGDRGEGYAPGKMDKLKGKFHIGKH